MRSKNNEILIAELKFHCSSSWNKRRQDKKISAFRIFRRERGTKCIPEIFQFGMIILQLWGNSSTCQVHQITGVSKEMGLHAPSPRRYHLITNILKNAMKPAKIKLKITKKLFRFSQDFILEGALFSKDHKCFRLSQDIIKRRFFFFLWNKICGD